MLRVLSYNASLCDEMISLNKTSEGDAERGGSSISVNNGYIRIY